MGIRLAVEFLIHYNHYRDMTPVETSERCLRTAHFD